MPSAKNQPRNLVKSVVDQLLSDIIHGKLKAGDTLPSEPELSKQLGVSRPTLRQALKPLENAGILKPRPRIGTVLCAAPPDALGPLFGAHMALAGVSKQAIAEARMALEQSFAELAARRRTLKDLSELRAAMKDAQLAGTDLRKILQAERRFHGALIEAAHNPVLSTFREILMLYFNQTSNQPARKMNRKRMMQTTLGHEQIYAAVRDRKPVMASAAMQLHLAPTLKNSKSRE